MIELKLRAPGEDRDPALGVLRVLSQDDDLNYRVQLDVLCSGPLRQTFRFENVERYAGTFRGRPILCAYVGGQVGDGHNSRTRVDPETGHEYDSFTDATAERIVGEIFDRDDAVWTEEREGRVWVCARGKIWRYYHKELVDKIVRMGAMEVSAEIDVQEGRMEGDTEVCQVWRGLGVTILGDYVPPAAPGAHVRELTALEGEYEAMRRAVARLSAAPPGDEQKKGVIVSMSKSANKKKLGELQKKFPDYRVVACSEDGERVCLMAQDGSPCTYTFLESDKGAVIAERIQAVNLSAAYAFGEESITVELSELTDGLAGQVTKLSADLDTRTQERDTLKAELTAMKAAEEKRRVKAAAEAVKARLQQVNELRAQGEKLDDSVSQGIVADIEAGKYTHMLSADGTWNGDEMAVNALMAEVGKKQMELDGKRRAAADTKQYAWETGRQATQQDGVMGLISRNLG